MGTHNRVLRLATDRYPRAYIEIIAINRAAPPPGHARWFDLDDPALQHAVRQQPRLVHFVARSVDAQAASKALGRLGIERGALVQAQRQTPQGLLRWQISVRPDGQRLFYGGLPMLIQWGDMHPADGMPESGLALQSLQVRHPRLAELQAAHARHRPAERHAGAGPAQPGGDVDDAQGTGPARIRGPLMRPKPAPTRQPRKAR